MGTKSYILALTQETKPKCWHFATIWVERAKFHILPKCQKWVMSQTHKLAKYMVYWFSNLKMRARMQGEDQP